MGLVICRWLLLALEKEKPQGPAKAPTASFRAALLPTLGKSEILGVPVKVGKPWQGLTQRKRLVCGRRLRVRLHHIPIYSLFVVPRVASCVRKLDLRIHGVVGKMEVPSRYRAIQTGEQGHHSPELLSVDL